MLQNKPFVTGQMLLVLRSASSKKEACSSCSNVFYEIKEDQRQRNQTLLLPDHYSAKSVTVYWGFEDGRMRVSDFMGGMIDLLIMVMEIIQ